MKILLFLSAILVATCSLAAGSKPPACKDPTYACQDLETARLCGVVSDCIHDIWSTMKAPNDDNEICDICKEMVKEARDQLLSNETQEEIKEVFEGSCELLYVKVIVDECKKIFDDLIPELIEMLASRMDPNMVCTVAGLCNNAAFKDLSVAERLHSLHLIPSILSGDVCDGCTTLLSSIKKVFLAIPQDQMKDILLQLCDKVSSVFPQCSVFVTSYLPEAYDYITNYDPVTLCDALQLCAASNGIRKPLLNYGDNLTCEFCESLVQHLRDIILTNSTKEEFRTALLNFCSIMGEFSSECKQLVNDYYDMIYDFIDENLDPEKVCTALGLCQSSTKSTIPMVQITPLHNMWKGKHTDRKDTVPLTKLKEMKKPLPDIFPAVKITPAKLSLKKNYHQQESSNEIGDKPIQQLPIERMQHPLLSLTRDTDCAFSKAVMFFLEKDVKARNTKAVTSALDNVCDIWMPGYMKECQHFVKGNYKKIVELLVHGVAFDEVTGHLGLCADVKPAAIKVMPPTKSNNDLTCDLCMQVMDYLKKELKDKTTEEEIKEALDKVCTYLPQSLTQQCQQFVNEYTDIIVQLLLQKVDPNEICTRIGLCPGIKPVSSVRASNSITCELCTEVMDYLKKELEDKKTEDEIREALDKVCGYLPQSLNKECQQFINEYTDVVITLLLQEIDPSKVCALIGLCPNTKPVLSIQASNSITCDLCTQVMDYLKRELEDKKTEDEIREALDKVCAYLPQSLNKECQQFVNEYTETIVTLILQEIDPSEVCALIGLCPTNLTAVKPLKGDVDCEICTTVMNYLEKELEDKTVESAIRTALDTVCSVLPQSYAVKCQQFVDKYTEKIIVLLVQNVSPNMVCSLLQECPSASIECTLCEYFLHFVQEQLMSNSTESEIKVLLHKLCSYLPGPLSVQCNDFIDEYSDALVVLVAQQLDPSTICPWLKACPSKNLQKQLPVLPVKNVKLDRCDICKTVVNYIDKLLEEGDVDQELTALAAKICSILPDTAKEECNSIVHIYGPYILRMIGHLEDGEKLCQSVDICPRTLGHVHLLGAEKCTFGPIYWCKTRAHAAACKAETYCKQNVWKN